MTATTWTREMAVELAREEYERGLAEGRAEAAAQIDRLRTELADVWDEGEADGRHNEHEYREGRTITNPYRQKVT